MDVFHDMKKKCRLWSADIQWAQSVNWTELKGNSGLFEDEAGTAFMLVSMTRLRHQEMADDIVEVFIKASFRTTFKLSPRAAVISMEEIVGYLARDRMLSDSVMDFSIQSTCGTMGGCVALSSLSPGWGCPMLPSFKIAGSKHVVMPVHLRGIHWGYYHRKFDVLYRVVFHQCAILRTSGLKPISRFVRRCIDIHCSPLSPQVVHQTHGEYSIPS